MKVKWAVIGATGWAGSIIIKQAILPSDICELTAVQSLDREAVINLSKKNNVPWFISVEEMIKNTECDAVYIASPQNVHNEHLKIAAKYKKHVFCEKPLALNVKEADEMVKACKINNIKFGTGFNLRFNNLHVKAKELVANGAIGKVVSARCQYGQNFLPNPNAFRQKQSLAGGGSMVDMGNHAMDLIEFVTGKTIDKVLAVTQNIIHNYEVEDTCAALLEFSDGGFAFVDAYYCMSINILRNDLEINGSKGVIYTVDSLRGMATGGKMFLVKDGEKEEFVHDGKNMYKEEFEAFSNAIIKNMEPSCSGADGLHSQKILEAVYVSAKRGSKVEIS
ncbi:MAG: Gfo/Idh/MocA family oxidoreductase [Actinobacteria bacterium]|nr:Gfo/Idh/MocA family oxidoreductase [Actinomycetota bacterium]